MPASSTSFGSRPYAGLRRAVALGLGLGGLALGACSLRSSEPHAGPAATPAPSAAHPDATPPEATLSRPDDAAIDASADALGASDPRDGGASDAASPTSTVDTVPLHKTSREDLLGLFGIKPLTAQENAKILPDRFLSHVFGPEGPYKINQGNPAISEHHTSRAACLAGLAGITLQTPEQRAICGHENMVPVHLRGKDPYFCVDIFEFPNKACELPMVWASPTYAKKVCELQGKRLCSQIEWQLACHADPNDGPDRKYAYGDTLDLAVCHTSRRHRQVAEKPCTTTDSATTWRTCSTDTEPSGSFPQCRSRYGVFDLHGNVAEIMMRRDGDGTVKTQLKGSAWFYDEVAREVGGPPLHAGASGAYPDHCDFDPRWHVENLENAWHVNYHLGFRCCKSVP